MRTPSSTATSESGHDDLHDAKEKKRDAENEKGNLPQANLHRRAHDLDAGQEVAGVYRKHWFQIWLPKDPPPPPPLSLDAAPITPLATASILSKLTYHWITPMIVLGYQRPLQAPDLWRMDPSREASLLSGRLDEAWARRVAKAKDYNARLADGTIKPTLLQKTSWTVKAALLRKRTYAEFEEQWRTRDGKRTPSLPWAINDVLGKAFWAGGLFKVMGDTSQLMGPLISKAIINFGKERQAHKLAGEPAPSIGRGIAMAIGLFLLTISFSVCNHQFFWRSMNTGILARCALISSLYKRGLKLTPKSRAIHPNAALVNHMSTDISRIDFAAQWFHAVWTAPIQVTICVILLLVQLGPSALAGFSVFLLLVPIQQWMMKYQLKVRISSMKWTDNRAGLLQELLSAMRIIKYFCYEIPFLHRINDIRHKELVGIRKILMLKAANQALAFSVPTLASVLAFVVYTLAGHGLDPAVIFTSLALFQLLRQPLMFFPRAISAYTDAENAFSRLTPVFLAETLEETSRIDEDSKWAVQVVDSDFQWEEPSPPTEEKKHKHGIHLHRHHKKPDTKSGAATPAFHQEPFALRGVNLSIPKGQLCAIAGPVGSGKSSLLLALIGEMKQTRGPSVVFGGSIGYCAQMAWIQNASLRDNILFGADFDEERYWNAVQDASLLSDLELLPDGDLTEIGEKGINLSGGQKQRVNIARALYNDAEIIILDDPLSAVDAHVGEALFNNAILGHLKNRGKTVILVTHALHFLHNVDYIYNIVDGVIVEQGTYDQLVRNGAAFSRLLAEFSGKQKEEAEKAQEDIENELEVVKKESDKKVTLTEVRRKLDLKLLGKAAGTGKIEGRLMKAEKRATGSIDRSVYATYLSAGNGWRNLPLIILSMITMQTAQILNSYWIIWWENDKWHEASHWYMALYAALGVAQAMFTFALGGTMAILSFDACVNLHHRAVQKVFHAPMSFFDTTPLGRILGVFGKDIDTIDNFLSDSLRMFVMTMSSALGAIVLITYLLHYFILAVAAICLGYWHFASYYRVSARELKRLDANLRSLLYSHFAESLSGLSTIRAYNEVERFLRDNEYYNDLEDRALFLTTTNQRWLAIRLDFMGACLIGLVALMAAAGVDGVDPAQIGLALVYCVSLTQMFSMVTRQSAEVENYMNAVERTVHYTQDDLIEQEPPHVIEEKRPPPEWPTGGSLQFKDVVMSYRAGLPPVLKGISMDIKSGEKIGVVGRTGAGKSSLMIALYRIVELSGGSIVLDGIDVATLGLRDIRSKISIIPQDPLLFSGTVRTNLDPFNRFDDAKLYDALRRAHLVTAPPTGDPEALLAAPGTTTPDEKTGSVSRFTLETPVEAEGANLSVGERSLLSLARALVRDEIKLVVMDEATASVDIETDNAIQETISKEFGDKTLLCIAHRLRTIIHYDRVLVMESGGIAEFDSPINLFRKDGGIFRSLCEQSKITEEDIVKSSEWKH